MRKKRPLTLLEITAALFLAGILLTTVIHFFHEYAQTEGKIKAIKETVLSRASLQLRLNQIFSQGEAFYTDAYTNSPSSALFFTSSEGIDVDGILYLNQKNELVLEIKEKKELLLQSISELNFRFFNGENWVNSWDKEEEDRPLMLTLCLKEKKIQEPLLFSFFFSCDKPITYQRKS